MKVFIPFVFSNFVSFSLADLSYTWNLTKPLLGDWIQIYNNRYVQESSEIDWDCTQVSIQGNQTHVVIDKHSILHHNFDLPIHKSTDYSIYTYNGELILNSIQPLSVTNPILVLKNTQPPIPSDEPYDYVILTGTDQLTLFVLVRNIDVFSKYLSDISTAIIDLHYTGYYLSPMSCYDLTLCSDK